MVEITFRIPDDKIEEIVAAFLWRWPKPAALVLSDAQWTKELIRRLIIKQVESHKMFLAHTAVTILKDDSIIA